MSFRDDFGTLLGASSALAALVGEKIFPGMADQGTAAPYVVWRRNGGDPLATLAATAANRDRQRVEVLVGCYADTYDQADAVAAAVFDALAAGSSSGTTRLRIIPRPPADGFDPDTRLYTSVIEASVLYRS